MNIISKMKQLKNLTPNEQTLLDFILKDVESFLKLKRKDIAGEAFVSVSTIYRLVDKLKLNGINEFKLELLSALQETGLDSNKFDYNFPVDESDSIQEIIHNLKQLNNKTLEEAMFLFDADELLNIINQIKSNTIIDIYTSSSNIYFAKNFQFQMSEIGRIVNVPEENYFQRITAANCDENHFPIIMSFGGRGQTTLEVIEILREKKQDFCLIGASQNKWKKYAKYNIEIPSLEDHYNKISSFTTRLSLLYIFDVLYTSIFNLNYEENLKFKLEAYKKINTNLD